MRTVTNPWRPPSDSDGRVLRGGLTAPPRRAPDGTVRLIIKVISGVDPADSAQTMLRQFNFDAFPPTGDQPWVLVDNLASESGQGSARARVRAAQAQTTLRMAGTHASAPTPRTKSSFASRSSRSSSTAATQTSRTFLRVQLTVPIPTTTGTRQVPQLSVGCRSTGARSQGRRRVSSSTQVLLALVCRWATGDGGHTRVDSHRPENKTRALASVLTRTAGTTSLPQDTRMALPTGTPRLLQLLRRLGG